MRTVAAGGGFPCLWKRRQLLFFDLQRQMSARWVWLDARMVVSQKTGCCDRDLPTVKVPSKSFVDVCSARLATLSNGNSDTRLGKQFSVDINCIAFAGIYMGSTAQHDPITMPLFQWRNFEGISNQ